MAKVKLHKCKYAHCKHDTTDISPEDEVKVGESRYWHKDCYEESLAIRDVIDIFYKEVNRNVVMNNLRKVVNSIVYEKGIDARMLRFGLRYYLDHGKPINYPQGLYYVIQNIDVQKAWNEHVRNISKESFEIKEESNRKFEYKPSESKGFANILA